MSLGDIDTERLTKTFRLALSSDKDGEVLAAIRAVQRMLASVQTHPIDLIEFLALSLTRLNTQAGNIRQVNLCLQGWDDLTNRERDFIFTIRSRTDRISEKQHKWLCDIASRLGAASQSRQSAGGTDKDTGAGCNTAHQGA